MKAKLLQASYPASLGVMFAVAAPFMYPTPVMWIFAVAAFCQFCICGIVLCRG